jgi:hypothetical protein
MVNHAWLLSKFASSHASIGGNTVWRGLVRHLEISKRRILHPASREGRGSISDGCCQRAGVGGFACALELFVQCPPLRADRYLMRVLQWLCSIYRSHVLETGAFGCRGKAAGKVRLRTGSICRFQRSPQFCLGRPKLLSGSAAGVRASAPHAPWHGSDAPYSIWAGNSVTAFF